MTKIEYKKCEKLMYEAINLLELSQKEYKESDKFLKENNIEQQEIMLRKADQHYGEGVGMNQVLATIGFFHDDMEKLSELI